MLNSLFDKLGAKSGDYYPAGLREEIDAINDRIYSTINNRAYRTGSTTTQKTYELTVIPYFKP